MLGILIISHGDFATGLLNAAEMIMGSQQQIKAAGLQPQDDPDDFRDLIHNWIQELDSGQGVLVLADLFGGSPANASAYLLQEERRVDVVTGVSLPMLLEVLAVRGNKDLPEVVDICQRAAQEGVQKFSEVFSGNR